MDTERKRGSPNTQILSKASQIARQRAEEARRLDLELGLRAKLTDDINFVLSSWTEGDPSIMISQTDRSKESYGEVLGGTFRRDIAAKIINDAIRNRKVLLIFKGEEEAHFEGEYQVIDYKGRGLDGKDKVIPVLIFSSDFNKRCESEDINPCEAIGEALGELFFIDAALEIRHTSRFEVDTFSDSVLLNSKSQKLGDILG